MAERIRAQMMMDPQALYPVLPKNGPPQRARSPAAISISSSSPSPPRAGASKPPKAKKRGMVIDSASDDDDDDSQTEDESQASSRSPSVEVLDAPPFPVPQPYKPTSLEPAPGFPRPEPFKPKNVERVPNAQQSTLPWNKPAPAPQPAATFFEEDDHAERFDTRVDNNIIETIASQADAQKAMVDLVQSNLADIEQDFDPEDAIVDGFQEGTKLLPHQVIGRKWMAEREQGKKFGGILADDMGLGKTIQTLTRIVEGRPSREEAREWSPTTLVVCPVSLISQWASEIKKMCVGLRVLEHTGATRTRDPAELRRHHVVITSYQTLASEHGNSLGDAKDEGKASKSTTKSKAKPSNPFLDDSSDDDTVFGRALVSKKTATGKKKQPQDALFKVNWWRIVLDEAHTIKNHKSKTSIACCELQSKFRWALTGTPLQNNVEELYAFFKFLKIRPLNDWPTFNESINKPVKAGRTARAMKRLQIVLQAVMLRHGGLRVR
ncbi:hypothetical protein EXIGLDRAFT_761716 [Exidia glandulosa HHB12029]|uniref:Helicase ATP-binding domain-containing protein n=1 Tax=Exidia glandulosa HHB12029 TaxID=1314781 RepID=A0A165N885_EXIGL|nr:hypothetical protein EXIGLDRAFT_761716 [Exidia glandulosa HHB12029]